jgi:TctA family transporter
MDFISNLGLGFAVALTLQNAAYCFIGVLLGTVIGVLPGIGPVTTVAMLLPISFTLQPEAALIMLAGIYYGAQYGGSTTAILVNIPGEASSVVTTIDGHQMARQGRAGPALGIAALGSFFAGCVSTLLIALAAPPLASIALQFGPAEYFSLMVCGLIAAVVLARGSLLKAVAMVVLGLLLGLVGTDVNSGARRFNFGMTGLADGIEFVAISMAIYGIAEVVYNLEKQQTTSRRCRRGGPSVAEPHRSQAMRRLDPAWHRAGRNSRRPARRRRAARFLRRLYAREKGRERPAPIRQRRHPGRGGPGIRQQRGRADVVHPDADLGHSRQSDHGDDDRGADDPRHRAGPARDDDRPGLFWGLIASMWLGNLMLVVLNLPMVGVWVRLLRVPYRLLYPAIIAFCCIGAYTINNKPFDAFVMAFFAVFGYVALKLDCEPAPLILGLCWGR